MELRRRAKCWPMDGPSAGMSGDVHAARKILPARWLVWRWWGIEHWLADVARD